MLPCEEMYKNDSLLQFKNKCAEKRGCALGKKPMCGACTFSDAFFKNCNEKFF